ncbi:histidine kinase [Glycomyces sp. NPDC047369]
MSVPRLPQWYWDAAAVVVAAAHLAFVIDVRNQPAASLAIVGVAALVYRRRRPFLVFLVTLPAAFLVFEKVASMIALYTLTSRARRPWPPLAATSVLAFCFALHGSQLFALFLGPYRAPLDQALDVYPEFVSPAGQFLRTVLFYVAMAAVPAVLGYSQLTRRRLAERLEDIEEAREHEQRLLTRQALAAERSRLAREMHDVVSHQVSLIAVQAGAMQLQAPDARTESFAATIREVSVRTLEELRQMLRVLTGPGGSGQLAPQPTVAEIERLVGDSGLDASLHLGPLPPLPPGTQRAMYRTVQEALTNVRKHAPGAHADVRVGARGTAEVEVEVVNGPAARRVEALPSSRSGLLGLRQRAELLDGRLESGPWGAGGWRVRLVLPAQVTSGGR